MLKILICAASVLGMTTLSATADISGQNNKTGDMQYGTSDMLPPQGYTAQWWTAPNKCEYSRAGRPGEVVWYLIINTAHSGCEVRLIQQAYSDYN